MARSTKTGCEAVTTVAKLALRNRGRLLTGIVRRLFAATVYGKSTGAASSLSRRTVTDTALGFGFTSRMNVLKKLPVAPSAEIPRRLRRLDAAGVVAAAAAVPVHRPLDEDRDAARARVDQRRRLAGGEAGQQVDRQGDPAARRDGDRDVHGGAVAVDADDAGRRLIGRVDGQDFFFEERSRRAFREIPAGLLRGGDRGSGGQERGPPTHRRCAASSCRRTSSRAGSRRAGQADLSPVRRCVGP